ncbi:MAG: hypothetical protein NTV70_14060 [Acidobacteria bacterium]|nr:hypothetical protein [Acidobacteriota bacterium]
MRFPGRSVAWLAMVALLFFVQCALACDLTPPQVPHCPKHAPESGHSTQKLCKDVAAVFDQLSFDLSPALEASPLMFPVAVAYSVTQLPPANASPPRLTSLRI